MADVKLTRRGFAMLAQALSGKQLTFTRVVFGDSVRNGSVVEPTDDEQLDFTDLLNPRQLDLPITACTPADNGTVALTFLVNNVNVNAGFYIREIGFFATIDEQPETLYAYLNNGLNASWLPAATEETWNVFLTLMLTIEQAPNVSAIIDGSLNYIAATDFYDHVESDNPHPNIPHVASNLSQTDFLWASGDDNNLHKISVQNLAYQIGGENSNLSQINSRLTQAETNLANLFMALKAKDDLGIDANLMLVEDFNDLDTVDSFSVAVLSVTRGTDTIELADDKATAGNFYMLSDGIHAQQVQITALIKSGSQFFAKLAANVNQPFNADCRLYRSTASLADGQARGSGDVRDKLFEVNETFGGLSANEADTLALNTRQSNVDAFTLEGDWAFDSNGYFTLA